MSKELKWGKFSLFKSVSFQSKDQIFIWKKKKKGKWIFRFLFHPPPSSPLFTVNCPLTPWHTVWRTDKSTDSLSRLNLSALSPILEYDPFPITGNRESWFFTWIIYKIIKLKILLIRNACAIVFLLALLKVDNNFFFPPLIKFNCDFCPIFFCFFVIINF